MCLTTLFIVCGAQTKLNFFVNIMKLFLTFQSAHMVVIEGMMNLFMKEVVSASQVASVLSRFGVADSLPVPSSQEGALLAWIRASASRLQSGLEELLSSKEPDHDGDDNQVRQKFISGDLIIFISYWNIDHHVRKFSILIIVKNLIFSNEA